MFGCDGEIRRLSVVEAPEFDPPPGSYDHEVEVSISTISTGATIRYTLDGSEPTYKHGRRYTGPIVIPIDSKLQAMAYMDRMEDSEVVDGEYEITVPPPPPPGEVWPPEFNPDSGSYDSVQYVSITSQTPGAYIYYTLDGSDPRDPGSSMLHYTMPVVLTTSTVIRAFATKGGMVDSRTTKAEYFIQLPPPPEVCDGDWKLWCQVQGHVSNYIDPYNDRFNLDMVRAPLEHAYYCTSEHMWMKDLLGTSNDTIWTCHLDPNDVRAVTFDEQGQVVLEMEFIFCDFERLRDVHGQRAVKDATDRFGTHPNYQPGSTTCQWLLNATQNERKGGLGYWKVHDLVTGDRLEYFYKRSND